MQSDSLKRISSGISGLDEILNGGYIDRRGYLLRGGPGSGKTTVGMHFLAEGVKQNESSLFITLGESEADLKQNARSIGIDAGAIAFLDLSPESAFFTDNQSYNLFVPAEMDRDPITKKIIECVKNVKPRRIFLDSTSHLRYLSVDAFQFRKQLLSFIRFLREMNSVILFTSESTRAMPDDDVMYLSDGIISLSLSEKARKIEVSKFRGSDFRTGPHTLTLTGEGAKIFPRLIPAEHGRAIHPNKISAGIDAVDALLQGGLEEGTVTMLSGPAGVGKTTLSLQFATAAAASGKKSLVLSFEESYQSMVRRSERINIPIKNMLEKGLLKIVNMEPMLNTADQIAHFVRHEVEQNGTSLVVVDGVTGFALSVMGDVNAQLSAQFKYLTNMGVSVIAVNETESITGDFKATEKGISYLADNIIFIRYLELQGEMRKAIGVLKKRLGDFERQLREFAITDDGIRVGKPLVHLRGILQGVPDWIKDIHADELISN